ncbi:MAG TPA: HU family DNA-binding protein [Paludibacter sp.]|nr:HU family DNA-binding protein [Paludibacter sp.]
MAVKFKVVELGNPSNQAAPKKFYPRVSSTGEISLRDLSRELGLQSTVSPADVLAVLESLLEELPRHLGQGEIVRLGDFGSFSLSITGEGQETADKVTSLKIDGCKIQFRPGKELKRQLDTVTFVKSDEAIVTVTETPQV